MPAEQEAVLAVRLKISSAQLKQEIRQAKAEIAEIQAQAASGAIAPAVARGRIATVAGRAQALQQSLAGPGGQGTAAQLKELEGLISQAGKTYAKLADANQKAATVQSEYANKVAKAAAAAAKAAAKAPTPAGEPVLIKPGSLGAVGSDKEALAALVAAEKAAAAEKTAATKKAAEATAEASRAEVRAAAGREARAKKDESSSGLTDKATKEKAVQAAQRAQEAANKKLAAANLEVKSADTRVANAAKDLKDAQTQRKQLESAAGTVSGAQKAAATRRIKAAQDRLAAEELNQRAVQDARDRASADVRKAHQEAEAARKLRVAGGAPPAPPGGLPPRPPSAGGAGGGTGGGPVPPGYVDEKRKAAEQAAVKAQALANDTLYLAASGDKLAAEKRIATATEAHARQVLANNADYIKNRAAADAAARRIGTASGLFAERSFTGADAENVGQLAALRSRRSVEEGTARERFLAADKGLAEATGQLAALRRRREIEERSAFLRASVQDANAEARLAADEAARRAGVGAAGVRLRESDPLVAAQSRQTLEDQALVEAQKIRDSASKRAQTQALLAADEATLRQNLASTQAAEAERKLAVQSIVREKLGQAFIERQVAAEVAQTADAERKRIGVIQATLNNEEGLLTLSAQRLVQSKRLQEAERELANATIRQAVAAGTVERGSFVQRLQAGVAARQGGAVRLPTDFATGPQLLKGAAITTARFAASGALLYGGFRVLKDTIKTAEELEVELGILRTQFDAIGRSESFNVTRDRIFEIARSTAIATDEAVRLGVAFVGAFGPEVGAAALDTAAKIGVIAGIETGEIFNDLVAGAKAFGAEDPAATLQRMADASTQLRNVTGVPQKELLDFLGRVGPIADTAGLSLEEASAAGAALLQGSGVGGSGLGEQFGRILTSFQDQSVEIARVVGGNERLKRSITEIRGGDFASFAQDLNKGDASILFDLAEGFDKLSESEKRQVISSIGSRREGQTLAALLKNSKTLIDARAQATDSAGAADREFARRQQTLQFQVQQLGIEFQQFALEVYNSALREFLVDLARLGKGAVSALTLVMNVFKGLNSLSLFGASGFLGQLLKGVLLARTLSGILGGLGKVGSIVGIGKGILSPSAAPLTGAASALTGSAAALTGAAAALTGAAGASAVGGVAGALHPYAGLPYAAAGKGSPVSFIGRSAAGQAASSRLAALGLTRFNLALAGTIAVLSKFNSTQDGVSNAADEFRNSLRDATDAEVAAIANKRSSFGTALATNLFGEPTTDVLAKEEQRRREALSLNLPDKVGVLPDIIGDLDPDQLRAVQADLDKQLEDQFSEAGDAIRRVFPSGVGGSLTGRLSTDPQKVIDELIKVLNDGTDGGVEVAEALLNAIFKIPGTAEASTNALAELTRNRSLEATKTAFEEGTLQASAEELKAQFQAGEITAGAYIRGLEAYRDELTNGLTGAGPLSEAFRVEIAGLNKEINSALSKGTAASYDLRASFLELSGGSDRDKLALATKALQDPNITDPGTRQRIAGDIVALSKAILEAEVSALDSTEAQIALLKTGIPLPEEARIELMKAAISEIDPIWTKFLNENFRGLAEQATFVDAVVRYAIANGVGLAEAARRLIEKYHNDARELRRRINARKDLTPGQKRLLTEDTPTGYPSLDDTLNLPDFEVPPAVTGDPAAARKAAAEDAARKARELRLAQIDVQRALIEGDPVAEADLDIQIAQEEAALARKSGDRTAELQAQAALIRARRKREESIRGISEAQRDLDLARRGDDPVAQAYNDLITANAAVNTARGAAAKLQAQAQAVRAQRALAEAFQDIGLAQLELAQAIANAAGDSVEAARKGLEIAKQQLANIRANSPNDQAAILRAQAEVVSSEAALRDANLSEQQRAIDVALQLEQITTQQAIAQLQALLQIPKLTQEQIDSILLKIKSLQDELKGDFRFNLPTQLYLPTAYEARRLGQTATGSGYNDNRQITVTVNAETNASPEAIATAVVTAVGQPNRTGTQPRRY